MKEPRVAARYAKSIMLLAKEKALLEKVYADMVMLHQLIGESKDLSLMLKSPILTDEKKLEAVNAIFNGHVDELTMNFMGLVIRQNRATVLGEIAEAFVNVYKAEKGIATVHVTTAEVLSSEMKSKIAADLKSANQLKEVEVVEHLDPAIIGGAIIRMGDIQLDESVKAKINRIEREFLNA